MSLRKDALPTIGFLLGSLRGAGAEKTILCLAEGFAKIGHQVHLILIEKNQDYQPNPNIKIWITSTYDRNPRRGIEYIANHMGAIDLLITSRAEFYNCPINAHIRYCSVHITPTAWLKKRPWWLKWKTWLQQQKLTKKFKKKQLIALSHGIRSDLINNLGVEEHNVTVIHNPFDFQTIQNMAREPLDQAYDFEYIIYVAALIPRKRHADLLHAFSGIQNTSIHLVLLGKGELQEKLLHLTKKLGITDRVHFLGWVHNPYQYIYHSKISVLTSQAEGMPRILIESIASGVPVVSTNCPSGPNEVLTGEYAEQLIPVGDITALRNTLNRTLKKPNIIQLTHIERFKLENVLEKYLSLL